MFEGLMNFFKKKGKKENKSANSKEAAKERLHLVLMQDRANVSADFLELMKQEIIEVIKKYIDVDEGAIDVRLTNKENDDGTNGAPALYANIPILNIKNEARQAENEEKQEKQVEEKVEKDEKIDEETEKDEKIAKRKEDMKEVIEEAKMIIGEGKAEKKEDNEKDEKNKVTTDGEDKKSGEKEKEEKEIDKKEPKKDKDNAKEKKVKSEK